MKNHNIIFENLWKIYTTENPHVKKVYDLLTSRGEMIINDHIAFRTFDDKRINIDVLSKPFLEAGYEYKGEYYFSEKNLYAKHFEHKTDENAPRVFISHLLSSEFSENVQKTVKLLIDKISPDKLLSDDLIYSGRLWGDISLKTYEELRKESEYAAWLYVNGFVANHFTVSVNKLKTVNGIAELNNLLKNNGFLMNDSGGEIKGNPSELLEQSSIKSGLVKIKFIEGEYEIPGCYYEFAMRYPDKSGKLYGGFIANSANKIFESTNFYKQ